MKLELLIESSRLERDELLAGNTILKENMSTLESNHDDLLSSTKHTKAELSHCKRQIQIIAVEFDVYKSENDKNATLYHKSTQTKVENSELKEELAIVWKERDTLSDDKVKLEDQRDAIQSEKSTLDRLANERAQQVDTLGAEKAMLKNELTTIQEDIVAARDDIDGNVNFLDKKKAEWEIAMQRKEGVLLFHVKKRGHELATVQGEFDAL